MQGNNVTGRGMHKLAEVLISIKIRYISQAK